MVAELSLSHIYARAAGDAERTLAQRIGTGDPLLSQDELVNIVSGFFGETEKFWALVQSPWALERP